MKNILLNAAFCWIIVLVTSNCSQQPGPQPTTPTTPATPNNMTTAEQALVGKWFLKRKIAGTTTNYNNPTYYNEFGNTPKTDNTGTTVVSGYNYTASNTGVGAYQTWKCNTGGDSLVFNSPSYPTIQHLKYKIRLCTTDSLILEQDYTSTGGVYIGYFYHK